MSVPIQNMFHVAQGLARLTGQFAQKPNIRAMLAVYLQPLQDLENAIWGVLTARVLRNATLNPSLPGNPVLDSLGALVGQPRLGMLDSTYQAVILLRVAVNRSTGRITDWSNLAKIVLTMASGPLSFYEGGDAAFFLGVWGMNVSAAAVNAIGGALSKAVPNGVYFVFSYSTWADGNDFEWTDDPSTVGQGGFGDDIANLVGGELVA